MMNISKQGYLNKTEFVYCQLQIPMQNKFKHNNIISSLIREEEEIFNQIFLNSLKLDLDIHQYEVGNNKRIDSDSTSYMTVWFKNIDRLMSLIPDDIKLENYHLCDVGCGLGLSTIYFKKKYKMKSFSGFDYNEDLTDKAKLISYKLGLKNKIEFEFKNANEKILESKPYLLFMFNPFGINTIQCFIDNNIEVLKSKKSIIIYANDLHVNEIKGYKKINRNDYFNLSVLIF